MKPDSQPPDTDADSSIGENRPLQDLLRIVGRPCAACIGACSPYELVWSIALGFKDAPRCLPCLAWGLERNSDDLQTQLMAYIERHACYRRAWSEASRMKPTDKPAPNDDSVLGADAGASPAGSTWDAGDMGCGDLVLALRVRLNALPAGAVLRLRATDSGAPHDIPAWCRLTGHTLVSADHPIYLIRRKGA